MKTTSNKPQEWFVDRVQHIRPMTNEERQRSKEREEANKLQKCVSCGGPSSGNWCGFCIEEE